MKQKFLLLLVIVLCVGAHTSRCQSWQWAQIIGGSSASVFTDYPDEMVSDIATDSQGNVYVCGRVMDYPEFAGINRQGYGAYDAFVAKYTCSGSLVWYRIMGNNNYGDEAQSLFLDGAGSLYLSGNVSADMGRPLYFIDTSFSEPTQDMFLAKLDTSGGLTWLRVGGADFHAGGMSMAYRNDLGFDIDGNINMLVWAYMDSIELFPGWMLMRGFYNVTFDTTGTVVRTASILDGGGGFVNDLVVSPVDHSFYVTGGFPADSIVFNGLTLYNYTPSPANDLYFGKLDSSGAVQWMIHLWDTLGTNMEGYDLELDPQGNVLLCGGASSRTVIAGHTMSNPIDMNNMFDFPFVAKYTPSGQALWAVNTQSQYLSIATGGITVRPNGNIVLTGFFTGIGIFGPDTLHTNPNGRDSFISEIDPSGTILWADYIDGYGTFDEPKCITTDLNDNIYMGGGYNSIMTVAGVQYSYNGGRTDGFLVKYGTSLCTTGISNATQNGIGITAYPNPASTYLTLRFEDTSSRYAVTLLNATGQQVLCSTSAPGQQEITLSLSELPAGLYYYQVIDNNGNRGTGKFVVE